MKVDRSTAQGWVSVASEDYYHKFINTTLSLDHTTNIDGSWIIGLCPSFGGM